MKGNTMKQLRFGLFENAQTNDSGTATWRHPENQRHLFDTLDYWRNIDKALGDRIAEGMAN